MDSRKEFRDDHAPYGYLITFRSYGTWLHGRVGSVDRFHNVYGTPKLPGDKARWLYNRSALKHAPVKLNRQQRNCVAEAICETCAIRKWTLWTSNVRTNHVHVVVTANHPADRVMNAFKANGTRHMRKATVGIVIVVHGLMAAARKDCGTMRTSRTRSLTSVRIRVGIWAEVTETRAVAVGCCTLSSER